MAPGAGMQSENRFLDDLARLLRPPGDRRDPREALADPRAAQVGGEPLDELGEADVVGAEFTESVQNAGLTGVEEGELLANLNRL